jgi:hypothetical protein
VAVRTESQEAGSLPALAAYLSDEIGPALAALGFTFKPTPTRTRPMGRS